MSGDHRDLGDDLAPIAAEQLREKAIGSGVQVAGVGLGVALIAGGRTQDDAHRTSFPPPHLRPGAAE